MLDGGFIKKLRAGEVRFIPKKIDKAWRVYDRARATFPYQTPELGKVLQDVPTEGEAQVECERLNKKVGITPEQFGPVGPEKKTGRAQTVEVEQLVADSARAEDPTWISESDIPDYGQMSPEEAAKYTEGIL